MNPARLFLCALAAATLTLQPTATLAAEALDAPARAELLARLDAIKQKHPAFQASFSEQRTSRLLKEPVTSTGSIAFQAPNQFRREVGGSNPSLTLSNGKELWLYYPNFKEAEQYFLGRRAMFDDAMAALTAGLNFSEVEKFYNLQAIPEAEGGYRITLTPRKGNLKRIVKSLTVYLDKDLDVRRTDFSMPKGDEIVTHYRNTKRGALPKGTFDFVPPAGTNITHPLGK